jgi:hypothetical protein
LCPVAWHVGKAVHHTKHSSQFSLSGVVFTSSFVMM